MAEKKQVHFGFTSYLTEGKITDEFINDFEYWTKKIFYHWKLFTTYEEFQSICWEALLTKLPEFDSSIATIQTFCLSRINNEAMRFYMKTKTNSKYPEITCDDPVLQKDLVYKSGEDPYLLFNDFVRYAAYYGISVNIDELYNDYKEEKYTAPMIAYLSWRLKNKELGGYYGISKRKR